MFVYIRVYSCVGYAVKGMGVCVREIMGCLCISGCVYVLGDFLRT